MRPRRSELRWRWQSPGRTHRIRATTEADRAVRAAPAAAVSDEDELIGICAPYSDSRRWLRLFPPAGRPLYDDKSRGTHPCEHRTSGHIHEQACPIAGHGQREPTASGVLDQIGARFASASVRAPGQATRQRRHDPCGEQHPASQPEAQHRKSAASGQERRKSATQRHAGHRQSGPTTGRTSRSGGPARDPARGHLINAARSCATVGAASPP